jgi:hypothetical protein
MAEHSKAALNFLRTLTAYLEWRANNRTPSQFDVEEHVKALARYIEQCGIARESRLHKPLVEFMSGMERAGEPPIERVPPST